MNDSTSTTSSDKLAEELWGAHLAHLVGADPTTRIRALIGGDLADVVLGWYRVTIGHGRDTFTDPRTGKPDTDPMAVDVLAIPTDLVGEFLNDRGVALPTREDVRAFADADPEGVDPRLEISRALYGVDLTLGDTTPGEKRICGVPQSIYDQLEPHEQDKVRKGEVIPSPRSPLAVARWLVRDRYTFYARIPGRRGKVRMRTLIRIDQTWYTYERPAKGEPPRWTAHTDPEWMPAQLQSVLGGKWYVHTRRQSLQNVYELKWWNPSRSVLADVEAALCGELSVGSGTAVRELPDVYGTLHNVYPSGGVLCRNGVLDPATGQLRANTPLWFSTAVIGAEYDHAAAPYQDSEWLSTLRTQWEDDPGAITCLQQWFGYVISGRTNLQKWMLIVGPSGSSKSIIADVLGKLVGTVTATTLDSLNSHFGLQALYETGAQLAVLPDIRFSTRDSSTMVGNLLGVIGEDVMAVERKNKTAVSTTLPVRFHGSANEMPRWADNSGALQKRALILETTKSFRDTAAEDPELKDRIIANELGHVLRWAVEGLALLNTAGGRFTRTSRDAELREEMDHLASTVRTFIDDCCELGDAEDFVDLQDLFRVWKKHAEETNSGKGMSQNAFVGAINGLRHETVKVGQKKRPVGERGKWRVVWGVKSASTSYTVQTQYGLQTLQCSTDSRSDDNVNASALLN
ncbi:DNA primase family protein [Rhodococcus aetherivorans]|uniref:DNA primase family protein n=1 Tax=Rhodococcus aetherivorans TaxID=191292 RepID=UPI001E5D13B9|nr:phage/plasmid primase, P4 family [Rhodococcus aetherivorans]UGQ43405.1 phage/plasmid primase, P4 family [Rhodococcus aetherivorans]